MNKEFKVMVKTIGGIWHEEFFVCESAARKYANFSFVAGSLIVELYSRTRNGYCLIKSVQIPKDKAVERKEKYVMQIAPYDAIVHINKEIEQ